MRFCFFLLPVFFFAFSGSVVAWEWPIDRSTVDRDFSVLEWELPPLPGELRQVVNATHAHSSMSHHIWSSNGGEELWLCGSRSPQDVRGVFKLVRRTRNGLRVQEVGRYLLQPQAGGGGYLWLVDAQGRVSRYTWSPLPDAQGEERAIELDGKRYLMRAYTPLESTCPI